MSKFILNKEAIEKLTYYRVDSDFFEPIESLDLKNLVGKTIVKHFSDRENLLLETNDGIIFKLSHTQECCEEVHLEDICGDLDDLLNTPLVTAEERTNSEDPTIDSDESFTWTFYEFATVKGSVTLRWFGSSNGYYSEDVCVEAYKPVKD